MVSTEAPRDRSAYTPQFVIRLSRELDGRVDALSRGIRESKTVDDLAALDERGAPRTDAIVLDRTSASFQRHLMPEGNVVVMRIPFTGDEKLFGFFPDAFDQERQQRELNAHVHGGTGATPGGQPDPQYVEFRGVFQDSSREAVHAWGRAIADRLDSLVAAQRTQVEELNRVVAAKHREEVEERRRIIQAGDALDDLGTGI
jgi:hypothetical protein